jgi:GNAT superfamily N-acetyltransferase
MTDKAIEIRALRKSDDRSSFCSGNIDLDRFFQRFAGQNQFRHHIGTTYVAIAGKQIAGFVTISSGEMVADTLQSAMKTRLPNYPLPVLRMVRLAVDEKFQRGGLGKRLLKTVLMLALDMRDRYGCVGIVVDAKPEAVEFYKTFGFITLELISGELRDRPQPESLFLPVATIKKGAQEYNHILSINK